MKLNETPVRTSRNFNINNIKLDNIEIPKKIPTFNKKTVTIDSNLLYCVLLQSQQSYSLFLHLIQVYFLCL